MITHGAPAAQDARPTLLKISESAFCVGLLPLIRHYRDHSSGIFSLVKTPRRSFESHKLLISLEPKQFSGGYGG
jgi:hypothetical protein